MTQPEYVPITEAGRVRPVARLRPPHHWETDRPGDNASSPGQPSSWERGTPGPDQGYALSLAARLAPSLTFTKGEHAEDAIAGSVAVAMRRAALLGRAPCVFDLEHAFRLFGFLGSGPVPADLVHWRSEAFKGAAHDYWVCRRLASLVTTATLALTPVEAGDAIAHWKNLLAVAD